LHVRVTARDAAATATANARMLIGLVGLIVIVFGPLAVERARAVRNERTQRARGAIEPSGDVYPVMLVAYPASFLAMIAERALRGVPAAPVALLGLALFVAAKALKWWAIVTLGAAWTFRVLVVPGDRLVARGPYRWLRHPNYLAVVGELVGTALMAGAAVTGPVATLAFGALLLRRMTVEERALAPAQSVPRTS
jgi:methyltransferase